VSLVVATALYIAVALVLTGLVPYVQLNTPDPIAVAVDAAGAGLAWLRPVVKVGAVLGLSSVVLVLLMGQARILFAMAEDVSVCVCVCVCVCDARGAGAGAGAVLAAAAAVTGD
jgi:amino acid transporter